MTEKETPAAIVFEAPARKKKKKNKGEFQYSGPFLARFQKLERGVTKAQYRVVKAIEASLATWREESDKSARKKTDGAVRDALKNAAEAMSRGLREAADFPRDVTEALQPEIKPEKWVSFFVPPQLR